MPGRRHHAGRVEGEHVALAAGVVADDDTALRRRRDRSVEQVVGEAARRPGARRAGSCAAARRRRRRAGRRCRTSADRRSARRATLVGSPSSSACSSARMSSSGSAASQRSAVERGAVGRHDSSVRSSTRGRGPTWLITSAAAIDPMPAALGEVGWRRVAVQEPGGVEVAGAGRVEDPGDRLGRAPRRPRRRVTTNEPVLAARDRGQLALAAHARDRRRRASRARTASTARRSLPNRMSTSSRDEGGEVVRGGGRRRTSPTA